MTIQNATHARLSLNVYPYSLVEIQEKAIQSAQFAIDDAKELGVPLANYDIGNYSTFWEDCSGWDGCVNGPYRDLMMTNDTDDDFYYNIMCENSSKIFQHASAIITATVRPEA